MAIFEPYPFFYFAQKNFLKIFKISWTKIGNLLPQFFKNT
jgi:hypothetical protein